MPVSSWTEKTELMTLINLGTPFESQAYTHKNNHLSKALTLLNQ